MKKVLISTSLAISTLFALSVELENGWNLVGAVDDINVSNNGCIKTAWVYDQQNGWSLYTNGAFGYNTPDSYGYNSINSVSKGSGFWLNVDNTSTQNCSLEFYETEQNTTIDDNTTNHTPLTYDMVQNKRVDFLTEYGSVNTYYFTSNNVLKVFDSNSTYPWFMGSGPFYEYNNSIRMHTGHEGDDLSLYVDNSMGDTMWWPPYDENSSITYDKEINSTNLFTPLDYNISEIDYLFSSKIYLSDFNETVPDKTFYFIEYDGEDEQIIKGHSVALYSNGTSSWSDFTADTTNDTWITQDSGESTWSIDSANIVTVSSSDVNCSDTQKLYIENAYTYTDENNISVTDMSLYFTSVENCNGVINEDFGSAVGNTKNMTPNEYIEYMQNNTSI